MSKPSAKVLMYTRTICAYCVRAKNLLKNKGVEFSEINLDERDHSETTELMGRTGMRTVPQIFISDELIGGYQELSELENAGTLDQKLGSSEK